MFFSRTDFPAVFHPIPCARCELLTGSALACWDALITACAPTLDQFSNKMTVCLQAAFFSHRIIHWGSRGRVGYPLPRLAISFAFSEPGFEPPYISITAGNHPDLAQRLCLAAAQMLVYHERFEPDKPSLLVYEALFVFPFSFSRFPVVAPFHPSSSYFPQLFQLFQLFAFFVFFYFLPLFYSSSSSSCGAPLGM